MTDVQCPDCKTWNCVEYTDGSFDHMECTYCGYHNYSTRFNVG